MFKATFVFSGYNAIRMGYQRTCKKENSLRKISSLLNIVYEY